MCWAWPACHVTVVCSSQHCVAVSYYKEAIALWQEYRERDVECDKLQRIHCLENLAGVLNDHPETVPEDSALNTEKLIEEVCRCESWCVCVMNSCVLSIGQGAPYGV